jgi:ubiquitin C-terminal hydrolase
MDPLFQGIKANDSKDLVNFIVMQLHKELNKAQNQIITNNNPIVDQTNQLMVFNFFINKFSSENNSIISTLFYFTYCTSTQCLKCNQIKYNFETNFFLIFPLEEIRKNIIKIKTNEFQSLNQNLLYFNPMLYQFNSLNFQNNIQNLKTIDIKDCFDYNNKLDYFTGDNAMYCNNCNMKFNSSYCTNIYSGPKILIIVLNRGKGKEFDVKLNFVEDLNLMNYIVRNDLGYMYKLIGVVTHIGESGAGGHFIAYCRSPIDSNWYKYNDEIVTKVTNFKKEIIDFAMPYILFYRKTN